MKDITLTSKQQKIELRWLATSFCGAILINVFSIILYGTNWSELYTQYIWVFIFTCVIYALSVGIRITVYLIKKIVLR